jgi:hypothetical protein
MAECMSEWRTLQKFLPMVNHGAKTRFVLKITEVIVADDDAVVVGSVLEDEPAKNRRDRLLVNGNAASEPIIVVCQALAIVVSGRCESDQTRVDHVVAYLPLLIYFGGRRTSVEEFSKVYGRERAWNEDGRRGEDLQRGRKAMIFVWPRFLKY